LLQNKTDIRQEAVMDAKARIELALEAAVATAGGDGAPPRLAQALRYAVFPGGARLRPRLCLAVAAASGGPIERAEAPAVAVELLHCASLVHDDLPCFDDADLRRGKPSVHMAFDEPTALLTGDALILLAFDVLARAAPRLGPALGPVLTIVTAGVGMPGGIIAGQAWESEASVDLVAYHRAKTGALFRAAVESGAAAVGADPAPWRRFGDALGAAYQLADDLRDAVASVEEIGKPIGQDAIHGRPNAVAALGVEAAVERLRQAIHGVLSAIPRCPGAAELEVMLAHETNRFFPAAVTRMVA
jgi:geranylgeranyl diphosphate synthase type II